MCECRSYRVSFKYSFVPFRVTQIGRCTHMLLIHPSFSQLSKSWIRLWHIQIRRWIRWHSSSRAIELSIEFTLVFVPVFIDRARRNVHIPSSSRNWADGHVMSASTTISRRSVHIYGNASSNHIFYLIGRWSFNAFIVILSSILSLICTNYICFMRHSCAAVSFIRTLQEQCSWKRRRFFLMFPTLRWNSIAVVDSFTLRR